MRTLHRIFESNLAASVIARVAHRWRVVGIAVALVGAALAAPLNAQQPQTPSRVSPGPAPTELGPPPSPEPSESPPAENAPLSGSSPVPLGPGALPVPAPAASAEPAPGRFHLHRPGTDIEGDLLTGSLASGVYVLKGNVVLHSDPKIDREIAAASESDDPLAVTADEIDVDRTAATYVAKGHVHFTQGDRSGNSDLAMLDQVHHTLDLLGHATVYNGDRRVVAEKFHYDTASKSFVGGADVRIYQSLPTPTPNASAATATPAPKRKRRLPF